MTPRRTTPADPDYQWLVAALDRGLAITDGDDHAFYDQFNKSDDIRHVVVMSEHGVAVGCGAIKEYDATTVEIKRMYTVPAARGRRLATHLLTELEAWAYELGYRRLILETGSRQLAAIRLYDRYGFHRMDENYGQYRRVANSICMEKEVSPVTR